MHLQFFLAILQLANVEAKELLRGIEPSKQSLYIKERFACLDGNGFGVLNDDYCDCDDNSDEPSTSACNNGLFYCQNIGHKPSQISTRFVDDGLCDWECCDGSDEKETLCPNVCEEQAIREAKLANETERIRKLGAKAKLKLFSKAKELVVQKKDKIRVLESTIHDLILKENECTRKVKDLESKGAPGLGEIVLSVFNKVIDAFGRSRSSSTEPSLSPTPGAEQLCAEGGKEDCDSAKQAKQDLQDAIEASKNELMEAKRKVEDAKNEMENTRNSFEGAFSGKDVEAYNALRDTCLEYSEGSYRYNFCWFKELKQDNVLLGKFDQNSWKVKDGRMRFENGQACYNGLIRHVIIQLVCSPEEAVISIAEPNMCEYFMEIGTSAFCEILPGDELDIDGDHSEL